MAVMLFSVGTFALVAGLVMVGFGIPINEFSFGNTLINAGITAAVGGLIVIALGVAVGQLRRIAELLAGHLPAGYAQPMDLGEATGASSLRPAYRIVSLSRRVPDRRQPARKWDRRRVYRQILRARTVTISSRRQLCPIRKKHRCRWRMKFPCRHLSHLAV